MVDRLDLKTGDKLTEDAFATVDANFAELDSGKAAKSDIPEVPDVSDLATKDEITSAVSGLASESIVSALADRVAALETPAGE